MKAPSIIKPIILLPLAVALIGGCAHSLDDVDRVQPNYVKKSDVLSKEY